ncbi:hypothetical protein CLV78_101366 [Aliiruegeria haliotis]|uniref:Cytoplasmic protein n=1 Tax=Aliiruegeria haliotis TaxID=1280846 RepID=A0A2T0RYL7_9RHOB|nr:cytoplasmic protein [Aliiruegeria haliotis]PRY26271.1 hypothetical protein CLV78_101366 [Aliiruegeria haliotis]
MIRKNDLQTAHGHSARHRDRILGSRICGCFCCLRTFGSDAITDWTDGGETALCPHCEVDAVLGDGSFQPLTAEFLTRMNRHWFRT